ncbi:MAG: aldehyde oxidase [Acholeplasmatales bacterium]|nr:MAG: aldehyde oxidase [Acholeplasmatales bacterium]
MNRCASVVVCVSVNAQHRPLSCIEEVFMKDISRSVPKEDHEEKVSGRALYVSDIQMADMHYAKTVRADRPHARIRNIRLPELPEGYVVVDHHDIPGANHVNMIFEDWPVFADSVVRHVGEPIMLVCGKDKQIIQSICDEIVIEYEDLEPVFDLQESVVHKSFQKGDAAAAFARADQVVERVYETGYQEQAYIEPQGFVGYLEGEKKVTLIGSIQCPYYVKNAVIKTLACDPEDVRVIQAAVGGAFGGKEEFPSLIGCQLAVAVHKLKKPIKIIYEREEDMIVTTKRHPSKTTMQAALDSAGRVLAIKAHVALDAGAYIGLSGVVLSRAMLAVTSAYTIDHLDVKGDVYLTHTVPNGAFRGFGAPQMIFAIDMFMHHLAKHLGKDPYQFRKAHQAKQGDRTATSGIFRDPILMDAMVEKATSMSDYHRKQKDYASPDVYRGIGMSWFLHGCGFTGSGESDHIKAKVRLRKSDTDHVYVLVAAVDMGQGAKTTLKKVVVETLGVPYNQVTFDDPDTDAVPDSGPTVASRTAMIVGGLLAQAAQTLKETWKRGETQVVEKTYRQPEFVIWDEKTLRGDAYPAYSWGVNIVEVSVSPVTYEVKVEKIWSVYDVGKALDERIVLGQADGGIAQGVAYGYLEVMRHHGGHIQHKNMTDYIIPTAVDMAPTETVIFDNPYALGPYGAKGVGELSLVGGAPAVAMAIEQAIGRPIQKIPATPEMIMELMRDETH